MKLLEFIGFIIKYLLIGLGIAALFIVFMPERFSSFYPQQQAAQPSLSQQPNQTNRNTPVTSFADMLESVKPAVVSIKARSNAYNINSTVCKNLQALPPETNACALLNNGSGVFINDNGYLVTNAHVIQNAASIIVELNQGQQLMATVIGVDISSDIALLKVDSPSPSYLPLPSDDQSRVGDWVFAVGTPSMAFEQTVTQGIVSAKFFSRVSHYIQTDASLRPGNSGGALVNTKGELIGITSLSTRSEQGEKLYQSYAISASNVKHVVQQLMKDGEVHRGWLGLSGDMVINIDSISAELNLTPQQKEQLQQRINQLPYGKGIVVTAINPQGPAEQAGLQPLDILTQVNHKPIYNSADLISAIWNLPPKSKVTVKFMRDGQRHSQQVVLGQRN